MKWSEKENVESTLHQDLTEVSGLRCWSEANWAARRRPKPGVKDVLRFLTRPFFFLLNNYEFRFLYYHYHSLFYTILLVYSSSFVPFFHLITAETTSILTSSRHGDQVNIHSLCYTEFTVSLKEVTNSTIYWDFYSGERAT